ncbi:MAG: hypothetical protein HC942_28305, partial [Microcoleus sp. SU_5_6]|nr:hypothetical protein [Microcoleus sp. SU_5_6]
QVRGSGATGAGSGAAFTLAAGEDSGCGSVGDCSACGLGELSAQGDGKISGSHTIDYSSSRGSCC